MTSETLEQSLARADAFIAAILEDPTEAGLARAVAEDPAAPGALLAVLHDRFVNAGEGFGHLEGDHLFARVLVIATTTWTPAQRDSFATQTMFHAAQPDSYRWMLPYVRALFRPEQVERFVLAALERGTPTERENASHLAYHVFDGDPDYALSEVGARRLKLADPLSVNG